MRRLSPKEGWTQGGVPARMLGPKRGWIVRSHIGWEENRVFFIRGWKPLPSRHVLKTLNLEGKPERESPKRTISASSGIPNIFPTQ